MHPLFFSSILALRFIWSYPPSSENHLGLSSQNFVPSSNQTYDRSQCSHQWDSSCNTALDASRRSALQAVARLMPKSFILCLPDIEINLPMVNSGIVSSERSSIESRFSCPRDECGDKSFMQKRVDQLASYKAIGLHVDTAVFASDVMQLEPEFVKLVTTTYRSPLSIVDFEGARSRGSIISFLKEKTINYLKESSIYIETDESTSLAVATAVEFKKKWLNKFDVAKTSTEQFTDALGSNHSVPIMTIKGRFRHGVWANLTYLELPYENANNSDIKMSMFCFSPPVGAAPIDFSDNFGSESISGLQEGGIYDYMQVELPKFKIESNIDVKEVVGSNMQYGLWPRNRSNFAGITATHEIYFDKYFQKTTISVDEEGTVVTTTDLPTSENYDDSKPFTDNSFYVMIGITAPIQRIIYFGRVSA